MMRNAACAQSTGGIIPTRSEIPLADHRWKLAFHHGFHGRAGRV